MLFARAIISIVALCGVALCSAQPFTQSELGWPKQRNPSPNPYPDGATTWLMADKGVFSDAGITPALDGDRIQQWNDQGGSGNNVSDQGFPILRPYFSTNQLNGLPITRWFGTNGLIGLAGSFSFTNPSTLFLLINFTSTNSRERVLFGLGSSVLFVDMMTNGTISFTDGSGLGMSNTLSANQWHILTCAISGANSILRIDGVHVDSSSLNISYFTQLTIGCGSCFVSLPEFNIAEMVWIKGTNEISFTESYLSNKWGL